jgi:endonuclease/exonuclease/phosphatase (EEP) superfamily protein YafD
VRKGRLASFARGVAVVYLTALCALVLALRFVGEDSWLLTPVMYAPRLVCALPLVLTVPALLYAGPRWMLVTQVAALALVVFPLMGLELHPGAVLLAQKRQPATATATATATASFRLLSLNVFFGHAGCEAILKEIAAHDPDVILLEAGIGSCDRALAARYPSMHVETRGGVEFTLASKFPVLDFYRPEDFPGSPIIGQGYVRYTLDTPLGRIDLFGMHPYSPRHGFEGARKDLQTPLRDPWNEAHLPHLAEGRLAIESNTSVRRRQVEAVTAAAAKSTNPVIIAGDTNLPALSRIYARFFGSSPWKDGFAAVGNGFGYTFPTSWDYEQGPWMRLDRIFVGAPLRFLNFEVGGRGASDHCPVIADIGLAR